MQTFIALIMIGYAGLFLGGMAYLIWKDYPGRRGR